MRHSPPSGLDTLNPESGVVVYTDGSAWFKDGSGGWAWIATDCETGEAWHSGGCRGEDVTNNRMEMQAWIEALTCLEAAFGPLEMLVYADSEYVGMGAMDRSRNRNKNLDLWLLIDEAIDIHAYVQWVHVRGHTGHYYNERVDRLASKARKKHTAHR